MVKYMEFLANKTNIQYIKLLVQKLKKHMQETENNSIYKILIEQKHLKLMFPINYKYFILY